jgi:hypothetical protein
MENLFLGEPIKQDAWYFQIKDEIPHSKRPIDKKPIAEILQMYRGRKFLCDTCGKELIGKIDFSIEDHIAHMINPIILWSCEDCIIMSDIKNGRVIAATDNF